MIVEVLSYLFLFVSGTFIGSFLNVVADRLQNGESIFVGRSHCEKCKKPLAPKDLLPILSFISLKGKCRYCSTKLSYYYPISEIITGLAFVIIAMYIELFQSTSSQLWIGFLYIAFIFSTYIVITISDLKYRIIPNKVVFTAIFVVLAFNLVNMAIILTTSYLRLKGDEFGVYLIDAGFWSSRALLMVKSFAWNIASAFAIAGFFLFLIYITKGRGMGGGDVKLGLLIGLFNSLPNNVLAIFLAFLLGAAYSLVMMILRKRSIKDTIPFGPFMVLGSVIAFFYGQYLLTWYFSLL